MRLGEIVLLRLPQPDLSPGKLRPVLVLAELPGPFEDCLVCGISSQLHHEMRDWDERLTHDDADFATSGLKVPSVIRLNWLAAVNPSASAGTLGSVAADRLACLRQRLAAHLSSP
ncbi:MAG: type II toxin-antitoxin system PemK/MazF family toxin [Deltaproteobacteria bacterium]|nr:type II toxin-antitoxin system PemK/MazF family toxin [Deltaproteobacteria bacterium]